MLLGGVGAHVFAFKEGAAEIRAVLGGWKACGEALR